MLEQLLLDAAVLVGLTAVVAVELLLLGLMYSLVKQLWRDE